MTAPPRVRIAPVWAAMTEAVRAGERAPASHVLARDLALRPDPGPADLVRLVRRLIKFRRWGGVGVAGVAPLPALLVQPVGSCLDYAVAVGTLASLLGWGVRWCVGWEPGGRIVHVWAQVDRGFGAWEDADPTPGVTIGTRPVDIPGGALSGWASSRPAAVARV